MLIAVISRPTASTTTAQRGRSALLQLPSALIESRRRRRAHPRVHDITGGERADAGRVARCRHSSASGRSFTSLLDRRHSLLASLLAAPFLAIYWLFNRDATIDGRRDWWLALIPFALRVYLAVRWVLRAAGRHHRGQAQLAALDASADAVRGTWWRTFGILLVVVLIALGPSCSPPATVVPRASVVDGDVIGVVAALDLALRRQPRKHCCTTTSKARNAD